MRPEDVKRLLEEVAGGSLEPGAAFEKLRNLPYADLGHSKIDTHREIRTGFPEVIYCEGKTPGEVLHIAREYVKSGSAFVGSRAKADIGALITSELDGAIYHERARTVVFEPKPRERVGLVIVVSAGTSDAPVAEEAAVTADALGAKTMRINDAGVSGLHRILSHAESLREANAVMVVAGMEGALPSVVAGLTDAPVIAVPTSVGYGASFGGLAALLGMLNSCASGLAVVNIDNGFGAAHMAATINRRIMNAAKGGA